MKKMFVLTALTIPYSALAVSSGTAAAEDRNVKIINESRNDIVRFYGSHVGRDKWDEDILGSGILSAGSSVNINFDDNSGYCMFDFKAVFRDGEERIDNRIDGCRIGIYRYR